MMLGKTRWMPVEPNEPLKYLEIGKNPAMIDEPFTERVNFWETIVDQLEEPEAVQ